MQRTSHLLFLLAAACLFASGCVSNPSTGGKSVGVGGMDGAGHNAPAHPTTYGEGENQVCRVCIRSSIPTRRENYIGIAIALIREPGVCPEA